MWIRTKYRFWMRSSPTRTWDHCSPWVLAETGFKPLAINVYSWFPITFPYHDKWLLKHQIMKYRISYQSTILNTINFINPRSMSTYPANDRKLSILILFVKLYHPIWASILKLIDYNLLLFLFIHKYWKHTYYRFTTKPTLRFCI